MPAHPQLCDLNVIRLARLVAAIERVAQWCDHEAFVEDDLDDPPSRDEALVLEGWSDALEELGGELSALNRREVPDAPLQACRTLQTSLRAIVDCCESEVDSALSTADSIEELLVAQGRVYALRMALDRLRPLLGAWLEAEPDEPDGSRRSGHGGRH